MEELTNQENHRRVKAMLLFCFIVMIGWFLYYSLYFIGIRYYQTDFFDFLNDESDCFRDFSEVNRAAMLGDPYLRIDCSNYPPLALLLGKLFSSVYPEHFREMTPLMIKNTQIDRALYFTVFSFSTVLIILLTLLIVRKYVRLHWSFTFVLTGMSMYSMAYIFCLDRGNYLIFSYIPFLLFILMYEDHDIISGIALAVCACIKVYPVLFLIPFIQDRKWKGIAACLITGLLGLVLPFFAFEGGIIEQFKGFLSSIFGFGDLVLTHSNPLFPFAYIEQKSNSLENIFRCVAILIGYGEHSSVYKIAGIGVLECISSIVSLFSAVMVVFVLWKNNVWWKKITALILAIILLQGNTFDYMLLFLIPCILLAIAEGEAREYKYIILLTIAVFIPKSWYYFDIPIPDISVQCVINPILLWFVLLFLFWETAVGTFSKDSVRKMVSVALLSSIVLGSISTCLSYRNRVTIDYNSGVEYTEYLKRDKNGYPESFKVYCCNKEAGLTIISSSLESQRVHISFTSGYNMNLDSSQKFVLRNGDVTVEADLYEEGQTISFELDVPFGETNLLLEYDGVNQTVGDGVVYFTMSDLKIEACENA